MKVCECVSSDAAEIAKLESADLSAPWSENSIALALEDSSYKLFKIEEDGELCGYGGVQTVLDEGSITNIVVKKDCRRKGYASAILGEIKAYCAAHGVKELRLEVYTGNAAAIALYEKSGFKAEYVRKNYYAEGDACVMLCRL